MKVTKAFILLAVFLSGSLNGSDRFFLNLTANGVLPFDSGYKDLYGKIQLSPEVKLGWEPFKGVFLWTGYGLAYGKGIIPMLEDETKCTQHLLSAGIGLRIRLSDRIDWTVYAGWCDIFYREESMGLSFADSVFGITDGSDIRVYLRRKCFVSLSVSYIYAKTFAHPTQSESVQIKPGGLRFGAGIGFTF